MVSLGFILVLCAQGFECGKTALLSCCALRFSGDYFTQ